MDKIEPGTAELAIKLTEYFRNMESRIAPEIEPGILDNRFTELLGNLRDSFTTAEAVREALQLGISESSVKEIPERRRPRIREEKVTRLLSQNMTHALTL